MVHRWQTQFWLIMVLVGGFVAAEPGWGQPVPDDTLGAENSRVRRATVRGREADLIEGGATRGSNLFHSFREFGVREGDAAYFANPATIENIFSRVTGSNPSNILGILGVDGTANLFFMNPNGIVFGPSASLDVGGSFAGTTANAIGFGEAGFFSATNPEVPSQVLTVNPSAFFFNQVPAGDITVQSRTPIARGIFGLFVPLGASLSLFGGNVTVDGGGLNALGGRINIGAIDSTGTIRLNTADSFVLPTDIQRGDVTFTNAARASVTTTQSGGEISILARRITLDGQSILVAGIFPGRGSLESQAGNIVLDATEQVLIQSSFALNLVFLGATGAGGNIEIKAPILEMTDGAQLSASTEGQGSTGNVIIAATDHVTLRGNAGIFSNVDDTGVGRGGNIEITSPTLAVLEGAQLSAGTSGQGDAGGITISSTDRVTFRGANTSTPINTAVLSRVNEGAIGNGGNIEIAAPILEVLNGANLDVSTSGRGDAGNVILSATDRVTFRGRSIDEQFRSNALSRVNQDGIGAGGNIEITTPVLELIDGAELNATTRGRGDAGSVILSATDRVTLSSSGVFSSVEETGFGTGGDIEVTAPILEILNGSQFGASTFSQGNAGNIIISATDRVTFRGRSADGSIGSAALSTVERMGTGVGGNVDITSPTVEVLDGARLATSTFGQGDAGNIIISASRRVTFRGANTDGRFGSTAFSRVEQTGSGAGGDIEITAPVVEVLDGAGLTASTRGQGNAGSIIISATDRITFRGSSPVGRQFSSEAFSTVEQTGTGTGSNIEIAAPVVEILDGAQLQASTNGQGNAGNVIIFATDRVTFRGISANGQSGSAAFSRVNDRGIGRGGNIEITSPILEVLDGGQLIANTRGRGDAGDVIISAANRVSLDGVSANGFSSGIFINTAENSSGRGGIVSVTVPDLRIANGAVINARTENDRPGGNVLINADQFTVLNGGQLITTTLSSGRAGNITLNADSIRISGTDPSFTRRLEEIGSEILNEGNGESGLFANTRPGSTGNGGNIILNTNFLNLTDRATITSSTSGQGNTGTIDLQAADRISLTNNSGITSTVNQDATGNSQRITLRTPRLTLRGESEISAATEGNGIAGDIFIRGADRISLSNSTISTEVQSNAIVPGDTATSSNRIQTQSSNNADRQGDITINTRSLSLNNGAQVTASTRGQGRAGDITVSANILEVLNGGRLITSTSSNRRAGNIRLDVQDNITLNGLRSGIFANTTLNSSGNGGRIAIDTTHLDMNDQARISAQSQGTGAAGGVTIRASEDVTLNNRARISTQSQEENAPAGDIQITAGNTFTATDSDVTTSAANASGGDIRLTARDVRLFGDSDIRTNSARDGGNITVNADTVVALDDSDVFASAAQGRGGDITLNTPAFFGDNYQPEASGTAEVSELDNNNRVDLNATGTVSSGTISTPDTSFIQNSLSDLTENVVDTDSLIANSCIARNETGGTFLITGTGGLPPRPGSASLSTYPTGAVRTEAGEAESSSWQPGDAIVEPQGVYRLPDGRLVLSRECVDAQEVGGVR